MPSFPPLHHDLTFLAPLSEARASRLVAFLAADEPSTVLDVGCGWGELLLRVLEAVPSARGLGVDLDEEAVAAARRCAAEHDPVAEEVRALAARRHTAYFDGYRGILGLAYLELVAV